MKKIALVFLIAIAIPMALAYLGEYKEGETVHFSAQFNDVNGSADSGSSNAQFFVFDNTFSAKAGPITMSAISGFHGFYNGSYTIPASSNVGYWAIRINGSVSGLENPATVENFKVVTNTTDDVYEQTDVIITEVDSVEENQATITAQLNTNFSTTNALILSVNETAASGSSPTAIAQAVWGFIIGYINPASSTLNASDTLKTIAENTEAGGW